MRSYLYVPAAAPEKLASALTGGADAIIVDLENAAAPSTMESARDWLCSGPRGNIWVRVNPGEQGHLDARAVVSPALTGLCVAKTGSANELAALGTVVASAEEAQGLPLGHVAVAPVLDTAAAVLAAAEIARAPRVARLQLGEGNLRAELGVMPGPDERELLWVRSMVVLASAAAGIEAPLAAASVEVHDLDALRVSTIALRRMGFRGRACVDPAQVPVVNEVFTPGAAEPA